MLDLHLLGPIELSGRPTGDAAPRHPVWVTVGVAAATDEMLGLGAGVTYALSPRQIVTLRALALEEFCICTADDLPRTLAAGLLYGVAAQSRHGLASVAAGLGGARVRRRVPATAETAPLSARTERTVVSVPLEAQLFWRPFRFLGLGVAGVAELNAEQTLVGALVGVQIGRLAPEWGGVGARRSP